MTLQDWQQHVTSKGIKQNDAVMMLNDAKAEIEWLNKTLAAAQELVDVAVEQMTHEANKAAALQEKNEQLRAALVDLLAITDELLSVDGELAQALPPVHYPAELLTDKQVLRLDNARRVLGEVTQ